MLLRVPDPAGGGVAQRNKRPCFWENQYLATELKKTYISPKVGDSSMRKGITIKTPAWVAEEEVLSLLRQDVQLKLAYYQSQCRIFEKKYRKTFPEFKAAIAASRKENFQKWEDYMDWETAHSACQELTQHLQELDVWKT